MLVGSRTGEAFDPLDAVLIIPNVRMRLVLVPGLAGQARGRGRLVASVFTPLGCQLAFWDGWKLF